jgi:hypothetical protein
MKPIVVFIPASCVFVRTACHWQSGLQKICLPSLEAKEEKTAQLVFTVGDTVMYKYNYALFPLIKNESSTTITAHLKALFWIEVLKNSSLKSKY